MNKSEALNHVAWLLAWQEYQELPYLKYPACRESVAICREKHEKIAQTLGIEPNFLANRTILGIGEHS